MRTVWAAFIKVVPLLMLAAVFLFVALVCSVVCSTRNSTEHGSTLRPHYWAFVTVHTDRALLTFGHLLLVACGTRFLLFTVSDYRPHITMSSVILFYWFELLCCVVPRSSSATCYSIIATWAWLLNEYLEPIMRLLSDFRVFK